jgi:hypothetical protein
MIIESLPFLTHHMITYRSCPLRQTLFRPPAPLCLCLCLSMLRLFRPNLHLQRHNTGPYFFFYTAKLNHWLGLRMFQL